MRTLSEVCRGRWAGWSEYLNSICVDAPGNGDEGWIYTSLYTFRVPPACSLIVKASRILGKATITMAEKIWVAKYCLSESTK